MSQERYGNCFVGVIYLAARCRFKGRLVMLWNGRLIPHLFWRGEDGRHHHFRFVRDVLPWPLYWIVFRGKLESISAEAFRRCR